MRYENKVVVVTGGSKGIGFGCARTFVGLASLLLVACVGAGHAGQDGGTGGARATGGTIGTGGHTGSGGATGGNGTGGAGAGGTVNDAGHDMSPAPCWNDSDCRSDEICIVPNTGEGICGANSCPPYTPCSTDSDCAPDAAAPIVCLELFCCGADAYACGPGCVSDADCLEHDICYPNHHCGVTPCSAGLPACPTDTTCLSGFEDCGRINCTSNSQCSNACVDGRCYSRPGECMGPVI